MYNIQGKKCRKCGHCLFISYHCKHNKLITYLIYINVYFFRLSKKFAKVENNVNVSDDTEGKETNELVP